MLIITCPHCGPRDHEEFSYIGDGARARPEFEADKTIWFDYVYLRDNPRGPHLELWQHTMGCRMIVKVLRDTASHAVLACGLPGDDLAVPERGGHD